MTPFEEFKGQPVEVRTHKWSFRECADNLIGYGDDDGDQDVDSGNIAQLVGEARFFTVYPYREGGYGVVHIYAGPRHPGALVVTYEHPLDVLAYKAAMDDIYEKVLWDTYMNGVDHEHPQEEFPRILGFKVPTHEQEA